MNEYQTAKHASYKLIVKEAKNKSETTGMIRKFASGIDRMGAICDEIEVIKVKQEKDITGITQDKRYTLVALTEYLVDISGALVSYALTRNDNALLAKVNFKESVVEKMTHAEVITASAIVLEEARKVPAEDLANEGISAAEMEEFANLSDHFKEVISDPREATIDRSGHTSKLRDLFKEATALKKNSLDRLASQFKRKDPDFYQKYKAAGNIIYRRSSKTNGDSATA